MTDAVAQARRGAAGGPGGEGRRSRPRRARDEDPRALPVGARARRVPRAARARSTRKGFLRNYGAYLGLDPEYLIDLYRIETSTAAPPSGQRPAGAAATAADATGARAFVDHPGRGGGGHPDHPRRRLRRVSRLRVRQLRARRPSCGSRDPPGNVNGTPSSRSRSAAMTEPNATVTVGNLPENPTRRPPTTMELRGHGRPACPGRTSSSSPPTTRSPAATPSTEIRTSSSSPTRRKPVPRRRPCVVLSEPAAGATARGPVAVAGTAAPGAALTVTAALERRRRRHSPSPTRRECGHARRRPAGGAGARSRSRPMRRARSAASSRSRPGRGTITVAPRRPRPLTRSVAVGAGARDCARRSRSTVASRTSNSTRTAPGSRSVSGRHRADGDAVELSADEDSASASGNAGAVRLAGQRHRRSAPWADRPPSSNGGSRATAADAIVASTKIGRAMAADSSFDLVSDFDQQELVNALDQARREIATRYDFKGSKVGFELGKDAITLTADDEYRAGRREGPARVEGGPPGPEPEDLRVGEGSSRQPAARCARRSRSSAA